MNPFAYRDGTLCAEDVPLPQIAAAYGTPCYVYSRAALQSRFEEFRQALAGRNAMVCYAVKANSNLAILNLFARAGAGFDIVSGGELARVVAAGGDPARVVFSGVGKTVDEIRMALDKGIFCFNVESAAELERLSEIAGRAGKRAPIALRVNPDVDPKTHPYISTGLRHNKFGVAYTEALELYRRARRLPHLEIAGIACHIGSQLLDPAPAAEAAGKILALADRLAAEGIVLRHLDLGGGIGIRYRDETPPSVAEYLAPILAQLTGRREKVLFEPGRALVGNAGLLLARVEHLKHGEERNFAVIDAAMNDLMRPALYDAWHDILPVRQGSGETAEYEVVGPVCESGDFLGHGRSLAVAAGDLLAIMSAGAYGMAMSSNYNSRPRAAEIMADGDRFHLVRERERIEQLFAGERILP
ncbi:MAG: diaminopimelate decarboxylase [Rhodocyclaceae bacterium]|jgi:diaminopimelate decarboxylase|uniref:Diaminopimelate decarboxylase n=1 Tax=Candidatus Desulfobacillus denitrificans TaxID=2608985 RepID=A0A809R395_9PROT|nr:diaminopimelate decarboxylase [Candidatus Desulfobacillus denitrificans]GJQ55867.1 MAG: diaminopimelate decarboxylase [Rhodocyclaceae bacterium]